MSELSREDLRALIIRFTETATDLDTFMSYFAEDAVYNAFDGQVHRGKPAIRAAFEPQFQGHYGRLQFYAEDLIVDEREGKAVLRWLCMHRMARVTRLRQMPDARVLALQAIHGRVFGWHGLDVLRFSNGLLVEKSTYAQAPLPLTHKAPALPAPPPGFGRQKGAPTQASLQTESGPDDRQDGEAAAPPPPGDTAD